MKILFDSTMSLVHFVNHIKHNNNASNRSIHVAAEL